jgi:hypothetical protein
LFKPLFPCFTSRHSLHLASSVSMLDWLNLSLLAENGSEILPLLFTAVCTAHSRCLIKLCRVNGFHCLWHPSVTHAPGGCWGGDRESKVFLTPRGLHSFRILPSKEQRRWVLQFFLAVTEKKEAQGGEKCEGEWAGVWRSEQLEGSSFPSTGSDGQGSGADPLLHHPQCLPPPEGIKLHPNRTPGSD